MNKRPLLITDIDGTLLNEYGQLPPANVRALQRWVDQGKILALATGRNLRITKPIAQVINRELFLILQDGGLIMHYPSRQVLQYHNLNYRAAWSAYDVFEKEDLSVMIFDPLPHGQKFTLWQNGSLSAGLSAYLQGHKPERICGQEGKHRAILGPSKIVTIDTQTTTEAVYHLLKTSLFEARVIRTEAVRLNAWFVEVGSPLASKIQGTRTLLRHLKGSVSEVIAVGDAENDIEMLQAADLGVAVANASERVKTAANLIISSNAEGGLAKFLETMLEPW